MLAYKLLCQLRLVFIGLRFLDGQDHTIGDDGKEDGVLKRRPFDQKHSQPSDGVAFGEDKEGGRTLFFLLFSWFATHFAEV